MLTGVLAAPKVVSVLGVTGAAAVLAGQGAALRLTGPAPRLARYAAVLGLVPVQTGEGPVLRLGDAGQEGDPALVAAIAAAILALPADLPPEAIRQRLPQIGVAAASALRGAAGRPAEPLLPASASVQITATQQPFAGYFAVDRLTLSHSLHAGGQTPPISREVFVAGDAVIVLPWDPVRDRVLVIDQFRAAMAARGEPLPWMLEPIAGRIDAGETPAAAAVREAAEEAGLALDPARLIAGPDCYPSPGAVAEYLYAFIAPCDLPDGCAGLGGLESEAEDIRAHLLPRAALTRRAVEGLLPNGPLALMALWLEAAAPRLAAQLAAEDKAIAGA